MNEVNELNKAHRQGFDHANSDGSSWGCPYPEKDPRWAMWYNGFMYGLMELRSQLREFEKVHEKIIIKRNKTVLDLYHGKL